MSSYDANELSTFTRDEHNDILQQIINNQQEVCAGMRMALCQMSLYYQSRLNGVNHDLSLALSYSAGITLHFDDEGIPYYVDTLIADN
ncbi:hypothetical protein [Spirosoma fluviale]|uniref:Uncharacterized protein n=1 Tax=Spirosoma fluviale TaxID=1597977 RepID=A0A286FD11_9BACT|nr:hypothetical protein [Spirosoma fluviale]SOD81118.1 hypothetical protein SAMN06269250_1680 [Spirosoma fluviale]